MYKVEYITARDEWEKFLQDQKPHSFLQSWQWGEIHAQTGSKIFRLCVRKHGTLVGVALLIKVSARRGAFFLIPHGPIMKNGESEATRALLSRAVEVAREEDCAFLRVCPLDPDSPENSMIYHNLGFRPAPIHMHPEIAWMLDVTKSEDQLLREMRKTTRYLIKKLETQNVEVVQSADPRDIETFWPVYTETAKRQKFTPFSKGDLRKEFEIFSEHDGALFFFGKYKGEVVAAAIIIFWNGQAFYHHSGSTALTTSGSNVSYLLQWRVIQEAKRRGCTLYNFWGISPESTPRHPWAGLSQFKKGFGGIAEHYLHAQDLPLSSKYWINWTVETSRRIKRGF